MAKLSKKSLWSIAVILSLVTSILVYNYLKNAVTAPVSKEEVTVLIAKNDIFAKTKITSEMVQEVRVPSEYAQPGAVNSLQTVVGVVARESIMSGEQITQRRLAIEGKMPGFSGIIPRDKRAITVAVTEVTGVAGFVKPGDYVDIIATFDANTVGDNVSNVLLQNILVLAANHDTEAGVIDSAATKEAVKDTVKTLTVTLAVTPDEAEKLTLSEEKGKIRLTLRPYMPLNDLVIAQDVTPADLVGVHSVPVKSSDQSTAPATAGTNKEAPPSGKPSVPEGKAIQVIRGTKTESIPVN